MTPFHKALLPLSAWFVITAASASPQELEQARTELAAGLYRSAEATLKEMDKGDGAEASTAAYHRTLGRALLGQGRWDEASSELQRSAELAKSAGAGAAQARVLIDLGGLEARRGNFPAATAALREAKTLAVAAGRRDIAARAAINDAKVLLQTADRDGLAATIEQARGHLQASLAADAEAWISLGAVQSDAQRTLGFPATWRLDALDALRRGSSFARALGEERLLSYAIGFTGALYADEERWEDALSHYRQAAFLASSAGADEALYRWQWRSAQALQALGRTDDAVVAYRQSTATLGRLRPDLSGGEGASFRERAAPVFFDLADLLLRRTRELQDPAAVEANLREVRQTLEQVKVAEVQEYFEDQCVQASGGATELDMIGAGAAVIYPILLEDRIELLVSLPGGMRQFTTDVSTERLTREVREFRRHIERYDMATDYLRHAEALYRWLIAPLRATLEEAGIDTLVFVPDGPLRTIPMSALFDGERFLVERYAIATTPGLTLTSPRPLEKERVNMFAGGLTAGVQGFSPLPAVGRELESISARFPSETIRDEDFLVEEVRRRIAEGDQEIVHIATHGQFDSDHTQSFLLAYDDKITMDRLQTTIASRRYQDEPLELLVLSACQTAAGDDRAALGLAGVALKAGARSALATLWFVNDESTARMIDDFYQYLGAEGLSKAQALRRAQVSLLENARFSHPSFWAPFLLIGNWL